MTSYQPLTVTAELTAPVIFDQWQPLDGILGAAIIDDPELRQRELDFRKAQRAWKAFMDNASRYGIEDTSRYWQSKGRAVPTEPNRHHFLPLATFGHGVEHGLWVYAASVAMPSDYERGTIYINKRLDVEQALNWVRADARKIPTAKGEFGSKHIPLQTIATSTLTWHVNGDAAALDAMLWLIRSVGKKRHRGQGTVRKWTVKPSTHDSSIFDAIGQVMRPLPATLLKALGISGDFEYAYTTYRPPYWDAKFAAKCAVGGTKT